MTAVLLKEGGQCRGLIVIRTRPVLVREVLQKNYLLLLQNNLNLRVLRGPSAAYVQLDLMKTGYFSCFA